MPPFQYAGKLTDFGFSGYESACYMSLVAFHPANGSQLSTRSGIARSRIYDVLRSLVKKEMAFEIAQGQYVPLPPEELKKRLRRRFETNLSDLESELEAAAREPDYDYMLRINGVESILAKAAEIIDNACSEIYIRLFPEEGRRLEEAIDAASRRGVKIRYIAMGDIPLTHDVQVVHPHPEGLEEKLGGRSFDLIADRKEALAGIFEKAPSDASMVTWSRNRWFVIAGRDSLRHDFYHYFLDKLYERRIPLSARDRRIYELIKADD